VQGVIGDTRVVLLLVRHGETPPNRAGLLLGRADVALSEFGREQAQQIARSLPMPDRVISSPLRRARETAEAFGRAVEIDERWIELDYGDLDGRTPASIPAATWATWRADASFEPTGGESLEMLAKRVSAACADLVEAAIDSTVVVVTHVSPVKAALAWVLGVPIGISWRMYVEDAGVARVDVGPEGPVMRWFNRGIGRAD
jgi:broad specificity phosphatase PhoE